MLLTDPVARDLETSQEYYPYCVHESWLTFKTSKCVTTHPITRDLETSHEFYP